MNGLPRVNLDAWSVDFSRADAGYRELVAIIGDSGNTASIGLHRALGFRDVGTLRNVGLKFGRWLDTVIMQYTITG
jgi:L-amino acid N-acyltransferase YncA